MGVYIKGMEMPKACAFCRIKRRNGKKMVCPLLDEEWDIHDPMSADHRLDNCPLVPVPPHGRLGDLDRLMLIIKDYILEYDGLDENGEHNFKWCAMKEAEMAIEDAPTIIPAEPGEEETT